MSNYKKLFFHSQFLLKINVIDYFLFLSSCARSLLNPPFNVAPTNKQKTNGEKHRLSF